MSSSFLFNSTIEYLEVNIFWRSSSFWGHCQCEIISYLRLSSFLGCVICEVLFYLKLFSLKAIFNFCLFSLLDFWGPLLSKVVVNFRSFEVVFYLWLSSIWGCFPFEVVFYLRLPSILGCLIFNVVFNISSSSIWGCVLL